MFTLSYGLFVTAVVTCYVETSTELRRTISPVSLLRNETTRRSV